MIGVPVGLLAPDITNSILTQNTGLQGTPQDISITSDYINRNGTRIITIANSIRLYRDLKQLTHLNIGWVSCALFQPHNIPTCKLCATIGHVGKHCRNWFTCCGYCAEPHTVDQCLYRGTTEPPLCPSCWSAGMEAPHDVLAPECPIRQQWIAREEARWN
ncbi:hypothetical protein HPB48_017410 [Haemaphysalis longicornis]|uniref:Uncharacterized protein n=1 Tax=Haemaphysalis longicornis TaxID=44386 RepID=A0A9J6FAZ0_HAELO|nr:hypothetical protein HPB48_017410 [Haemaphysalis longicornis]